jgi:hypothetical protein
MGAAKEIVLRPISASRARAFVRRVHYSGKVQPNSQLHLGVFYHGRLEGALQFGPSIDKRKAAGLVADTKWHEFIELNRMAFSDTLPRNSESRALGVAMRLVRKHAPQVKWVLSYADATQCGDGTIYRASGFVLTAIKNNNRLYRLPNGKIAHGINMTSTNLSRVVTESGWLPNDTERTFTSRTGATLLKGHQLRYIYFLDSSCRGRLTVPEIPFSEIAARGAGMYKGEKKGYAVI